MAIHTVELSAELDGFVAEQVQKGYYADDSAVLSAALSLYRQAREEQHAQLLKAIDDGFASGVYEGDPFQEIFDEWAAADSSGKAERLVA